MKFSMGVLVVILLSLLVFTACGERSAPSSQAVFSPTNSEINVSQDIDTVTNLLEEFMNAVNNQDGQTALDLFNDSAVITTIDESVLGTTLPQTGIANTYSGKASINDWLNFQTSLSLRIVPQEYGTSADTVILKVVFNYPTLVEEVRMDAQTEGNRFSRLYVFIEKTKYVDIPRP